MGVCIGLVTLCVMSVLLLATKFMGEAHKKSRTPPCPRDHTPPSGRIPLLVQGGLPASSRNVGDGAKLCEALWPRRPLREEWIRQQG